MAHTFGCFAFLVVASLAVADRPRGVPLNRKGLYDPSKDFTCLDGSATIKFAWVNDDYCDCQDGSDEPGTSACPKATYHCVNLGHSPADIPSSRVNDQICDCCDGSDEFSGVVQCANICDEIGKQARIDAERRAQEMRAGFEKRKQLVKEAETSRLEKQKKLDELKNEKDQLDPKRDELDMTKQDAEKKEQEAKDQHNRNWEDTKQERQRVRATNAFVELDTNQDGSLTVAELQSRPEFDKDGDGTVSVEDARSYLMDREQVNVAEFVDEIWESVRSVFRSKDADKRAKAAAAFSELDANRDNKVTGEELRSKQELAGHALSVLGDNQESDFEHFVSTVWDKIDTVYIPSGGRSPPSPSTGTGSVVAKPPLTEKDYTVQPGDETGDEDEEEEVEGDEVEDFDADKYMKEGEQTAPPPPEEDPEPEYDDETKRIIAEAESARNAYNDVDKRFKELENEIKDIEKFMETDFGPESAFAPLKGQCFSLHESEYVYSICFFDKCTQNPKAGGMETRLGEWGVWTGPEEDKYSQMKYERGQSCWNGPERSTLVKLSCGEENKLISASEPGRCEYEFTVQTPAACSEPKPPHHLDDEL